MDPSFFLVLLRKPLVVIHQNRRGGHHALKRIDQRHFLGVIYEFAEGRGGLPCRCDRVLLALLDGHSPIRSRWSTVAFALACGPTLKSRSTAHAPKGLWLSAIQPEGLFLLQHDVDRPHQLSCGCHDGDLLPPPLAHLLIESRYGRIVPPNVDAGALDHYPVHHRVSHALRGVLCLSRLTHTGR